MFVLVFVFLTISFVYIIISPTATRHLAVDASVIALPSWPSVTLVQRSEGNFGFS